MDLTIKNEKLLTHFEAEHNIAVQAANQQSADSGAWAKEHPESILYNYLDSFLEICEASGIQIDLTYATAKNIGPGLIALFSHQKKHYEHSKNVDIVAKTLAAALSYLAIKEHNCWFRTTSDLAQVKAGKARKQSLWAGVFSIAVGRKNMYIDLLPCSKAAVIPGTILIPDGLTLQIAPVVAEYKKLTGVDLAEYGFANLFVN